MIVRKCLYDDLCYSVSNYASDLDNGEGCGMLCIKTLGDSQQLD